MEFELNQIFIDEYPEEAADFCNESKRYHIEEIDPDEEGHYRFQIVENPQPTEEEKVARATSIEARIAALEDALAEMMMEM